MSGVVYIDGQYSSHADAKISVFDHGLLYGDGVFEGIRVYNHRIFKLKSHLVRLFQSARFIDLNMRRTLEDIDAVVRETVRRSGMANAYIRLVVTRGIGPLGVNPKQCEKASLIVIVDKLAVYPEEKYETGITLMTSSVRQKTPATLSSRAKTLNYLPNMMAKLEALRSGADEALLLNDQGFVSECVGENVFAVTHSPTGAVHVVTPDVSCGILEGVTRNTIISLAEQNGITIAQGNITLFDLYTADEIFLTGTGAEIVPVISLDGRTVGTGHPGNITRKLLKAFRDYTATGAED
ncbi:MAG: branched-chain-amino-acid transaminase [Pirellulaceae bacterium]|nr:branched-chain-amino-acid transaminase [Pirellulaceae bacterium]